MSWLQGEGAGSLDGDEFESELNRNRLRSLRALDGQASLSEELTLRLVGPTLDRGALSLEAGSLLLKPLQESVASLAENSVDLELVGLSSGSTVLHLRPRHSRHDSVSEDPQVGSEPIDSTSTEAALRSFVELLSTAEAEGDLRRWIAAADSLGRFSKALDKLDARADLRWSSVSGEVVTAWFGKRGQDYVSRMLVTASTPESLNISGRVTELRESGLVKVKTGRSRRAMAYEVRFEDPAELLGMRLELGQEVHFLVRLERQVDRLGQTHSTEVYFVSSGGAFLSSDDVPLDDPGA